MAIGMIQFSAADRRGRLLAVLRIKYMLGRLPHPERYSVITPSV